MRIAKLSFCISAMLLVFVFAAQPTVHAGQNLTIWPIVDARGDSSDGCLTIYYEVVGWDGAEERVLMFFFLRLYEKKTRTWHLISGSANETLSLIGGAVSGDQQQKLLDFLNGPVLDKLKPGYSQVYLTGVENDIQNLQGNEPPYVVGADITIVAK